MKPAKAPARPATRTIGRAAARKAAPTLNLNLKDLDEALPLGVWALGLTAVLVLGLWWCVIHLHDVLLPFVVGFVLAYLLQPVVRLLSRWGVHHTLAVILCLFTFIAAFLGLLGIVAPLLVDQVQGFVLRAPAYAGVIQHDLLPQFQQSFTRIVGRSTASDMLDTFSSNYTDQIAGVGMTVVRRVLGGVNTLAGIMAVVVITPVVAFYMLLDWKKVLRDTMRVLPANWQQDVGNVSRRINRKMSAYLRGQLVVCLLMGIYYGSALTIMGLEMGWLIGFATGMLAFIPLVGAILGAAMMLGMALVQFQLESWWPYAIIGGIYFVGQFIEGHVLTPQLVGREVGIHPLWIIFALLAGGSLAGLLGMLLALPMAVVLSEVIPPLLDAWRQAVETSPKKR